MSLKGDVKLNFFLLLVGFLFLSTLDFVSF